MTGDGGQSDYNGLRRAEPTLPSADYFDPAHYERELVALWHRNWVYVCRGSEIAVPLAFQTFTLGSQTALILRGEDGALRAFHNTCRHRGSVLCLEEKGRLGARLISCPYHRWGYDLDGNLVRVPSLAMPEGFDKAAHGLYPIAVREWRGLVFVCFAADKAPPFEAAFTRDSERIDHWPLEELVTAHVYRKTMACNWKVFWENFSECLHCPGIHPELCELVPLYGRGIVAERDDPHWQDHAGDGDPRFKGGLRQGGETWSMDGKVHGERFKALSEDEQRAGQTYVTSLPSMFIVGHVDYMRIVSLKPLGPETTALTAEWLLPAATLARPDFDLENIVGFARLVLDQDAAACELNQRGLKAAPHAHGVLMPEEYYVYSVHEWIRAGLAQDA